MYSLIRSLKNKIKELDKKSIHPFFYPFWMSKKEIVLFDKRISSASNILEFGAGGSTLRALLKSKAKIVSVESDAEWIESLKEYSLIKKNLDKRLFFHHANIGPTGLLGYPLENLNSIDFSIYSKEIFKSVKSKKFDLVLIDGRFRVACALQTILNCGNHPMLKIFIHDYSRRPEYQVLEEFLEVEENAESLYLFKVKSGWSKLAVQNMYELYKMNPY